MEPVGRAYRANRSAADRKRRAQRPCPRRAIARIGLCQDLHQPFAERGQDLRAGRFHRHGRRSEEHTSELQSRRDLVCRLLLEKKKKKRKHAYHYKKKKKTK